VTLFGKEADNKGPAIQGIVWEMIARMQKAGFTVSLDETKKVYGKLQTVSPEKVIFHNTEQIPTILRVKDNLEQWKNTIKDDQQVRIDSSNQLVEEDSFTKPTINNPDSSRGFYIMKFALWNKKGGVINERNPHYLGVVDMAGNEDPYDIISTMMPTVKLSSMNNILDGNTIETRLKSDIVYNTLLTVLPNIMKKIIDDVMTVLGSPQFTINFEQRYRTVGSTRYFTEYDYLNNFVLDNKKTEKHFELQTDVSCRVAQNKNQDYTKYVIAKDGSTNNVEEDKCFLLYKNDKSELIFYFNIKKKFIQQILEKKVNQNDKPLSVSQIREQLMLLKDQNPDIKSDAVERSIIKYLVDNPSMITIRKSWFCISFKQQGKITLRDILTNPEYGAMKKIKNELRDFFTAQPYIIKTKEYDNENSFSSISSILAEGFFINQANAELINLFRQKKNGIFQKYFKHKIDKIPTFDFNTKFSVKQYDKFAKILGENELESTNFTLTELVPTLTDMFGTDAKDIMFACLKDEKDVTQAKGAIDTLYLVQDIKST
jgi:hypothetical protein